MSEAQPRVQHAPDPTGLNQDAPWTWTLDNVKGLLNQRQTRYIHTLENLFQVKTSKGKVLPYQPEPYQAWFHAHSPLAMGPQAPDRLVPKGRGIGATLMTCMDTLLLAHTLDRVHIPVAGRQAATGDEFIDKLHELMHDTTIPRFFDPDPAVKSFVRLGNGSTIEPIPGGNPSSIRSKRAPALVYDEYAFHPRAREIWRAGNPVVSEGGQRTVLSTHDGSDTHFFELVDQTKEGDTSFLLFEYPIHDPDQFDAGRPIPDQVHNGPLELLAPWLDTTTLEKLRQEDPLGYRQENLAEVMDEAYNLVPRDVVNACHVDVLEDWEVTVDPEAYPKLSDIHPLPRIPHRPREDPHWQNPVYVGVDFASKGDLAAYSAFEQTPDGLLQRWLLVLQAVDTPHQNALLRAINETLRPTSIAIDMTGPGTGLYEYAKDELSCQVMGIHFSRSVEISGERVGIKKPMALGLARALREANAILLGDHPHTKLQKKHLRSIRRSDLDAYRKAGEGHGDIFWSLALALWAARHGPGDVTTVRRGDKRAPRRHEPGTLYGSD